MQAMVVEARAIPRLCESGGSEPGRAAGRNFFSSLNSRLTKKTGVNQVNQGTKKLFFELTSKL